MSTVCAPSLHGVPTPEGMKMNESGISVEAFESMVSPHLQTLYGFACRRLKNTANAEDLVQDTLMRAWDRIGSLENTDRIRPWLFTILVHLHNEQSRKQARRRKLAPVVDLDESFDELVASTGASPLDTLIRQSAVAAVRDALEQVPDVYAVALEMRAFDGLSYKEIAAILEIPEGTVMSRVGRGRRILAGLLSEWRAWENTLVA